MTWRPHSAPGADVGSCLRVGVTADGAATFVWTALSPVITAGGKPKLDAKGGIDLYAAPHVGERLWPYFRWSGSPRSVAYRWQRCDAAGRCLDISGATRIVYYVRAADAGKRLRVVATARSGGGSTSTSLTTKPVR